MAHFKHKIILITGGTGSFGQAVLNRLLKEDVKEIRIFSRDEKKQEDMRLAFKNSIIKFYLGDVRDMSSLDHAMIGVDYVFHAAALKQVPSCEFFPLEAVKTNILGTENVLQSAIQAGVKKVICLSTDKAVYPINAMGISKAMMEKVMIAKARMIGQDNTLICATRYGNVMGSRGSVIPLFIKQIKSGKPLTITNPKMTRFLMTMEEAVDLVMYSFEHAKHGDIMVQKAPACTIEDLAKALLHMFKAKNPLHIIGTRHGEKLFESLLTKEEYVMREDLGTFLRIPADNRDLNYDPYVSKGLEEIAQSPEYNSNNTDRLSVEEVVKKLLTVPEVQEALLHEKND
jgi:UDP-N-acetylglucosamine 4,6-dehydratase